MGVWSRSHKRNGFTLVEIMLVVIIIAALSAMVVPFVLGSAPTLADAQGIAIPPFT